MNLRLEPKWLEHAIVAAVAAAVGVAVAAAVAVAAGAAAVAVAAAVSVAIDAGPAARFRMLFSSRATTQTWPPPIEIDPISLLHVFGLLRE